MLALWFKNAFQAPTKNWRPENTITAAVTPPMTIQKACPQPLSGGIMPSQPEAISGSPTTAATPNFHNRRR